VPCPLWFAGETDLERTSPSGAGLLAAAVYLLWLAGRAFPCCAGITLCVVAAVVFWWRSDSESSTRSSTSQKIQIFFLGRWREHPPEAGCEVPVTLFEHMAVDTEGNRRVGMAQPGTDGHRVETSGDCLGG
jgi:hypothetical protein